MGLFCPKGKVLYQICVLVVNRSCLLPVGNFISSSYISWCFYFPNSFQPGKFSLPNFSLLKKVIHFVIFSLFFFFNSGAYFVI